MPRGYGRDASKIQNSSRPAPNHRRVVEIKESKESTGVCEGVTAGCICMGPRQLRHLSRWSLLLQATCALTPGHVCTYSRPRVHLLQATCLAYFRPRASYHRPRASSGPGTWSEVNRLSWARRQRSYFKPRAAPRGLSGDGSLDLLLFTIGRTRGDPDGPNCLLSPEVSCFVVSGWSRPPVVAFEAVVSPSHRPRDCGCGSECPRVGRLQHKRGEPDRSSLSAPGFRHAEAARAQFRRGLRHRVVPSEGSCRSL